LLFKLLSLVKDLIELLKVDT